MFNKPIDQMNFDELRNAVQILYDAFERQGREYADLLQNLDFDNFAPEARKEISNTVSEKDLETVIEQTAEKIGMQATRMYDLSKAVFASNKNDMEDPSLIYYMINVDESKTYYYYNSLDEKWKELEGSSIFTVFEQTAEGFVFKGDVIVGGTLNGVDLIGATLEAGGTDMTGLKIKIRPDGIGRSVIDIGTGFGIVAANYSYEPKYGGAGEGNACVEVSTNGGYPLILSGKKIIFDAGSVEGLGLPLVFG